MDGGELGSLGLWKSATGTIAVDTGVKRTGGYSIRANPSSGTGYVTFPDNVGISRFSFWIYINSAPDTDTQISCIWGSNVSAGQIGKLYLTTTLELDIYDYDGKNTDGTTQLSTGSWIRISGAYHFTNETVSIWIDGNLEHDAVSINSNLQSGKGIGVITTCTADIYFEDIFTDNTVDTIADIGTDESGIIHALPDQDKTIQYDVFNPSDPGSGSRYTLIDDAPGSLSTDDNIGYADKSAVYIEFYYQSASDIGLAESDIIDAVKVCAHYTISKDGDAPPQLFLFDTSFYDYKSVTDLDGIWAWDFLLSPDLPSGGAWTQEEFDGVYTRWAHIVNQAADDNVANLMLMVAYHAGAAGEQYNESFTVGLTVGETVATPSLDWTRSLSEGLSISESILRAVDWTESFTEALTISETVNSVFGKIITFSKGLTVSETMVASIDWVRSFSKGLTAALTLTISNTWSRSLSLSLTISETITAVKGFSKSFSKGLTIAQTVANRAVTWTQSFTKGLTIAETILRLRGRTISFTEGLTIAKTFVVTKGWNQSFSESLTVALTITKKIDFKRAFSKGLTIAETILASVPAAESFVVGLVVNQTFTKQVDFHRAFSKGLTIAETITRSMGRTITFSKGLTASLTISGQAAYNRAMTLGITILETITKQVDFNKAFTKGLTIAETVIASTEQNLISFSVGLVTSVTFTKVFGYTRTFSENLNIAATIIISMPGRAFHVFAETGLYRSVTATISQERTVKVISTMKRIVKSITTGG